MTRALWDAHACRDRGPLVVIDEAHLLSPAMLEEIRFLTLYRASDYAERSGRREFIPRKAAAGGWKCSA